MKQPHPHAMRVLTALQDRGVPEKVIAALARRVPALATALRAQRLVQDPVYLLGVAFDIVWAEQQRILEEERQDALDNHL